MTRLGKKHRENKKKEDSMNCDCLKKLGLCLLIINPFSHQLMVKPLIYAHGRKAAVENSATMPNVILIKVICS